MMKAIKSFFEKHNLRPFESIWLFYVHIMALVGIIYAISDHVLIGKIILTHCIIHNLEALGITAGAHRLWSHKAYQASTAWKVVVMILNSGTHINNHSCKSRFNLPLEQRSQATPQVFGHWARSTWQQKGIVLFSRWMALVQKVTEIGRIGKKNRHVGLGKRPRCHVPKETLSHS